MVSLRLVWFQPTTLVGELDPICEWNSQDVLVCCVTFYHVRDIMNKDTLRLIKEKIVLDYKITKQRLFYGFVIAILTIIIWFVLILLGHTLEGNIIGVAGLIALVRLFTGGGSPSQGATQNESEQVTEIAELIHSLYH